MKIDSKPFMKTKSLRNFEAKEPTAKLREPSELNEKNLYLFNK